MYIRSNFKRALVIGNSGSGKSWLSGQLAELLEVRAIDLDAIHWQQGGYNAARDKQTAISMVQQASTDDAWIIEGVFGWLAEEAASRATILIWCDIPADECLRNLRQRGLRKGGDEASFAALLAWAQDYPRRNTSSSHKGHERIFESFVKEKARLSSRQDMANFLSTASSRWIEPSL